MIANEGGGAVSYDVCSAERQWTGQEFPTAQFYHVITTSHVPYHVCGAQQDNSTMCVSSATTFGRGAGGGGARRNLVPPYEPGGGDPRSLAPGPTAPPARNPHPHNTTAPPPSQPTDP